MFRKPSFINGTCYSCREVETKQINSFNLWLAERSTTVSKVMAWACFSLWITLNQVENKVRVMLATMSRLCTSLCTLYILLWKGHKSWFQFQTLSRHHRNQLHKLYVYSPWWSHDRAQHHKSTVSSSVNSIFGPNLRGKLSENFPKLKNLQNLSFFSVFT